MNLEELRQNAMDLINEHFADCAEALDSWNGFLGDDRIYSMDDLDELHYGMKLTDFLERVDFNNFNLSDDYWYYDAYGYLCSYEGDRDDYYKDLFDAEDLLVVLIDNIGNIDLAWIDRELADAVEAVANYYEEDEQE